MPSFYRYLTAAHLALLGASAFTVLHPAHAGEATATTDTVGTASIPAATQSATTPPAGARIPLTFPGPSGTTGPDGKPLQLKAYWQPAAGPGRHDTVILLHGCGGLYAKDGDTIHPRHAQMADLLHAEGRHVLLLDSFSPRGKRSICTEKYGERDIKPADRKRDVQSALNWLQTRADTDAKRTVLLGWSNGASTVLTAVNRADVAPLQPAPLAAVAFYPGCTAWLRADRVWRSDNPVVIWIGEKDDWTPAQACTELAKKVAGGKLTVHVVPDAYHDFDAPNTPLRVRKDVPNGVHPGEGVTVGSNPAARESAYRELKTFLRGLPPAPTQTDTDRPAAPQR